MSDTFTITEVGYKSTWRDNAAVVGQRAELIAGRANRPQHLSGHWTVARVRLRSGPWEGQALFINGFRSEPPVRESTNGPVCYCDCYEFPHRAFSGSCNADELVESAAHYGYCQTCPHCNIFYGDGNEPASFHCAVQEQGARAFLRGCPAYGEHSK